MTKRFLQRLLVIVLCGVQQPAIAQVLLHLNQPVREQNNVSSARQYLSGRTCKGCRLYLNSDSIYVYPTGAFAIKKELAVGRTAFTLTAADNTGKTYTKQVVYYYRPLPPPSVTPVFRIDYFSISPQGNLQLVEGDTLRIKMKAYPGCKATWINNVPLQELPADETQGIPGFYEGLYVIQDTDSLLFTHIKVTLQDSNGNSMVKESGNYYSFMRNEGLFTPHY
jgi:N-acetylmuramoyl-L-alanine amidase